MEQEAAVQVESKVTTLIEPNLGFIREIKQAGGDTLKNCFQCATCSVVCALSPDEKPYPRKEMIYSQWGLKERLVNSVDVWLCHYCNDCSAYCPRGARPGDVLRAIRAISFRHFAFPSRMGRILGEAKYLPVVLAIPVLVLLVLLGATGHLNIPEGEVVFSKFVPIYLVDTIFLTVTGLALISLAFGVRKFLQGIHANAVREGYAEDKPLVLKRFLFSLVLVIPTILFHNKFRLCTTRRDRYSSHLLVFFGFVGLFIVTSIVFLGLYGPPIFGFKAIETPYSIINPVKWLALVSGFALLVGIILVIANRLKPKDVESTTTYLDWALIGVILGTVVTGLLATLGRMVEAPGFAYVIYFIHLVFVFYIIAYIPFSKLAHLVYRTFAMAYADYVDRPFGVEVSGVKPATMIFEVEEGAGK
jgi:quinone-modifying oxidoreductase subunit QmoC